MELLAWYNLIFVAPVGLAAVYLALSATGIGDLTGEADVDADADMDADFDHDVELEIDHDVDVDLDADADFDADVDLDMDAEMDADTDFDVDTDLDADFDADADLDMDADVDADADFDVDTDLEAETEVYIDHDLELDHDLDSDVEADAEAEIEGDLDHDVEGDQGGIEHEAHHAALESHEPSLLIRALSVLGFGKVPVSVLMICLMVIFGATGLVANGLFETVVPWDWAPALYVWPSLALALFASFGLTGKVARGLNRIMPTKETYAVTEEELVGQVGVSVYGIRDGHCGPINVKDTGGTLHQEMGRSIDGPVPKGTEVLLVRYHRREDYYDVATSPLFAVSAGAEESVPAQDRPASRQSSRDVQARDDDRRASSALS